MRKGRTSPKGFDIRSRQNLQKALLATRQTARAMPRTRYANTAPLATRGWNNISAEVKYIDLASNSYGCDTTGSVTALNLISAGDDVTNRNGRIVNNKSIRVHGFFQPQTNNTQFNYCRVMLIWDAQPNSGSLPAITAILTAATSLSNTNLDNRERFTVLRDTKIAIASYEESDGLSGSPSTSTIDWYVPLKHRTVYSGTSATIGAIASGSLLLLTIGSAASGSAQDFRCTTRLRFSDP